MYLPLFSFIVFTSYSQPMSLAAPVARQRRAAAAKSKYTFDEDSEVELMSDADSDFE
jgi:hypothetical protein